MASTRVSFSRGTATTNAASASASVASTAKPLLLRPASPVAAPSRPFSNKQSPLRPSRVCAESYGDKAEPTFRVSGELLSSAPPWLVWEVLTDYDGAAQIFGNVSESRVLGPLSDHRKGNSGSSLAAAAAAAPPSPSSHASSSSSSYYYYSRYPSSSSADHRAASSFLSAPFEPSAIEQHCSWKFLLFGGSFRMLLGVEEGRPALPSPSSPSAPGSSPGAAALERSLVFSLLEPGFVRVFEGAWSVAVVEEGGEGGDGGEGRGEGWNSDDSGEVSSSGGGGGRSRRTKTMVRHSLGVTPAVPPPVPLRPVVRKLFQKQVGGLLDDLEKELERRMK